MVKIWSDMLNSITNNSIYKKRFKGDSQGWALSVNYNDTDFYHLLINWEIYDW